MTGAFLNSGEARKIDLTPAEPLGQRRVRSHRSSGLLRPGQRRLRDLDRHSELGGVFDIGEGLELGVFKRRFELPNKNRTGDELFLSEAGQFHTHDQVEHGPIRLHALHFTGKFHTSENTLPKDPTQITNG